MRAYLGVGGSSIDTHFEIQKSSSLLIWNFTKKGEKYIESL